MNQLTINISKSQYTLDCEGEEHTSDTTLTQIHEFKYFNIVIYARKPTGLKYMYNQCLTSARQHNRALTPLGVNVTSLLSSYKTQSITH